jgi:hypothetical protein
MKGILVVLVLLVAGVVGFGFYEGWFRVSTGTTDSKSNVTIEVDKDKIEADKEKVEGLGQKVKDRAGGRTDTAKEQEPRP